jgi:3-oxoacyl-(acyl-carrier-protein) synthase
MGRTKTPIVVTGYAAVTFAGRGVEALGRALQAPDRDNAPAAGYPMLPPGARHPYAPVVRTSIEGDAEVSVASLFRTCFHDLDAGMAVPIQEGDMRRTVALVGATIGVQPRWSPEQPPAQLGDAVAPGALSEATAGAAFVEACGLGCPYYTVNTACASGSSAFVLGCELIRIGFCDRALVAAAEVLTFLDVHGFRSAKLLARDRARPFDRRRDGIMLGEGAALFVLEAATRSPEAPQALVAGWSTGNERHDIAQPEPDGRCLADTISAALAAADVPREAVDYLNAHGTGTRANDASEARAFRRLWPAGVGPAVSSTKGLHGHLRAAGSLVELAATLWAMRSSKAPPTFGCHLPEPEWGSNLVTGAPRDMPIRTALKVARGFGGVNAAIALEAP